MTSAHAQPAKTTNHGAPWLIALASLAAGAAFLSLWFWLLPPVLGFRLEPASIPRWRWLAVVPSILGFAVALKCIWDFGWTGRGTPIPLAPPKKLVVVGFYRYVRNPMYVGFFVGWFSLWIVFGRSNGAALAVAVAAVFSVALFVRLYEEPTLRKLFGDDYREYSRNVPRWFPRLHPWTHH